MTEGHSMVVADGLSYGYPSRIAVSDLSFAIEEGERVALVGPNGAGKTTLLRLMSGLLAPATGSLALAGRSLAELSSAEVARLAALVPLNSPVEAAITAGELVLTGLVPELGSWATGGADGSRRVLDALAQTQTEVFAARPMHTLSAGEVRRVMIARALVRRPKILLMDEPLAALDLGAQGLVLEIMEGLAAEGVVVVVAMHDLNLAIRNLPRVLLLDDGKLLADGKPREVLSLTRVQESFGPAEVEREVAFFPKVLRR